MQDTGRNFEPIFMNFTWLVRNRSWLSPIVFRNNQPLEPQIGGKMCHLHHFIRFKSDGMFFFLRKKLKISIQYPHFLKTNIIFIFVVQRPVPKNGHVPQK